MRRCAELAVAATLASCACSVASPETEVREVLARAAPLVVAAAGAEEASLDSVRYADVTVSMDGGRALVIAVVEADGRLRAGDRSAAVAYVGREAFAMERCGRAGWCPAGEALPALRGVLAALPAVRSATAAEAPGYARDVGWQIRVERDGAMVGHDFEVNAGAAAPVARRARHALARDGGGWRLADRR